MKSQGFDTKSQTLYQTFNSLEAEGPKNIGFDEFFSILTARSTDRETRDNSRKVFAFFDDEKTGFISAKNLKRIVKELGLSIDEQ